MTTQRNIDHQALIEGVRAAILAELPTTVSRMTTGHSAFTQFAQLVTLHDRITHTKLVYGVGRAGVRGVTYFEAWDDETGTIRPVVELGMFGTRDAVQVACTTVHEFGHVIAGMGAQHGPAWKSATSALGIRKPRQAGQTYYLTTLEPRLRTRITTLIFSLTGKPAFNGGTYSGGSSARGCTFGHAKPARATSPILTYACSCGTRISSTHDVSAVTCTVCDGSFAPVSNGKRGRPAKAGNASPGVVAA